MGADEQRSARQAEDATVVADGVSAMVPRFNFFFRWFARRFFRHFDLPEETVERLRELESRGTVVYVMRYASRLDYFLFNTLFAREGLRLSAFANGLSFYYYAPLHEAIGRFFSRRFMSRKARREEDRKRALEKARQVALSGESMFLFLRTQRLGDALRGREAAVEQGRREFDLLGEIVRAVWTEERPVHLVPVALFWRKGPRSDRRFLNLSYGAQTRPSDIAKVSSFLFTYRDLAIKMGEAIDLRAFIGARRSEGERSIVRKVRRSILLFLYREERVVEGPSLRPPHRVQESVLGDPAVEEAIRVAAESSTPEATRARAEKLFREISANMSSTVLAILYWVAGALFRRLFVSIDVRGIEKVASYAKEHPVVVLPSHRSYFDFLILSWIFYDNYLVPPHIAARENMAFGPFGWIFRRCGAFFLRRSFDEDLYKAVFRSYVGYLVKEGFTQEFFIEGGRSRTGKSLAPRLGILSWNVQAFVDSGRRDLFIVPLAITYERLVEESAMVDELGGAEKTDESMLGLVRARKVLKRRFGSVFLNFGEPISLAKAIEGRRELYIGEPDESGEDDKRVFTEALGNEIVERINWAMVANATSVVSCAVLGEPRRGLFRTELVERIREVVELLHLQDVRLTDTLAHDEPDFTESIDALVRDGLLKREEDPRGEILFTEGSQRRSLDVYRNVLFHFLATPSVMARRLLRGGTQSELRDDLDFWLDLLYREFFVPRALVRAAHFDAFLDHFERIGVLEREDEVLRPTEKGRGYFRFLAEQIQPMLEAYTATCAALAQLDEPRSTKALEKDARDHFARARLLGELARPEGWNPVTFRNALDLLARRGILEPGPKEGRDSSWQRGEAFEDLAGLAERLQGALTRA